RLAVCVRHTARMQKRLVRAVVIVVFCLVAALSGRADATWEYSVQVSATVDAAQPKVVLSWPQDSLEIPSSYTIYRKTLDATSWGSGTTISGAATSFTDTAVQAGTIYEYQIYKVTSTHNGYGYAAVGIN